MIPELGNAALYMAFVCSVILVWCNIFGRSTSILVLLWGVVFACVVISLLCLVYSFATSDFTVLNVVNHSHSSKPLIYKVSAAWGNHEGSMLLWIGAVIIFSLAFSCCYDLKDKLIRGTLACQALLVSFFIAFTILTSNPFKRIFPAPLDGYGLNPILQDIGLALHPPVLYLGYVGFSLTYSAAISGLLLNRINSAWALIIRPWVIASWALLTAGIGLGSWWAYRELGWGGFWFWDPVENASLMPWLVATALIHALVECGRHGSFRNWAALLALFTFILSMVGTFIVRSGLITSVHSFVLDPKRGIWILCFLIGCAIAGVGCYIYRIKELSCLEPVAGKRNWWREGLLWMNNLLLVVIAFMVLIGTLYPALLEALGAGQLSVGAPYYNTMGGMLAIPLLVFCALGSVEANLTPGIIFRKVWYNHRYTAWFAALVTIAIAWQMQMTKGTALALCFAAIWLMMVIIRGWVSRRPGLVSHINSMMLAHLGVALVMLSIAINAGTAQSGEKILKFGETVQFRGFDITLDNVYVMRASNYIAKAAELTIIGSKMGAAKLHPELRIYPVERQQTSEAAILHHPFYDLYTALTDLDQSGTASLRIYYKPMMGWLWLGCALIAMGGAYSIMLSVLAAMRKSAKR